MRDLTTYGARGRDAVRGARGPHAGPDATHEDLRATARSTRHRPRDPAPLDDE